MKRGYTVRSSLFCSFTGPYSKQSEQTAVSTHRLHQSVHRGHALKFYEKQSPEQHLLFYLYSAFVRRHDRMYKIPKGWITGVVIKKWHLSAKHCCGKYFRAVWLDHLFTEAKLIFSINRSHMSAVVQRPTPGMFHFPEMYGPAFCSDESIRRDWTAWVRYSFCRYLSLHERISNYPYHLGC